MPKSRHLELVATARPATTCRAPGCALHAAGTLGFCAPCQSVYEAALALYARTREADAARIEAAYGDLVDGLDISARDELLAHLASHAREGQASEFRLADGITDYLADLCERQARKP